MLVLVGIAVVPYIIGDETEWERREAINLAIKRELPPKAIEGFLVANQPNPDAIKCVDIEVGRGVTLCKNPPYGDEEFSETKWRVIENRHILKRKWQGILSEEFGLGRLYHNYWYVVVSFLPAIT